MPQINRNEIQSFNPTERETHKKNLIDQNRELRNSIRKLNQRRKKIEEKLSKNKRQSFEMESEIEIVNLLNKKEKAVDNLKSKIKQIKRRLQNQAEESF